MKRKDIILTAVLLLAALLVFIGYSFINQNPGSYVLVTVGDREYARYKLGTDRTERIPGESGSYCVMEIEDGRVRVSSAGCPDKICVKRGSVHYNGESIICLPGRIVITVISDESSGLDAVVGK